MSRPSIAAALICKNEEKHIARILGELEGLVDHIYLTDTGSTDKTLEIAKSFKNVTIKHFTWVNDFAKARNHSFKDIKQDYIMWIDCDDSIPNKAGFIDWRDNSMAMAEAWLATYNYAFDKDGNSVCSFGRERVVRNLPGFEWHYFIHEGIRFPDNTRAMYTPMWSINHLRTVDDIEKDRGRNIAIFESHDLSKQPSRMLYYYGKELFEAGKFDEAIVHLSKANSFEDLEFHDRVLCLQYITHSLLAKGEYVHAFNTAQSGLLIAPTRAEFFSFCGDALIKQSKFLEALPYYRAAASCPIPVEESRGFSSVIFRHESLYGAYPLCNIARIHFNSGDIASAKKAINECLERYPGHEEATLILADLNKSESLNFSYKGAKDCYDIVITCPIPSPYEWDEDVDRVRGVGGSETAAIEMSKALAKITASKVIIFNKRKDTKVYESGVEYRPIEKLNEYFAAHKPRLHIAWRHSFKITDAKTVVWSHDLVTPGGERHELYDKYICLSDFHSNFVRNSLNVPKEKIWITRNGIRPNLFEDMVEGVKNPYKIVFPSSPDRGLEECLNVLDLVRREIPEIELHTFYGTANMEAMGQKSLAAHFTKLCKDRPWVKTHGNVKQSELINHYQTAAYWIYPTNFFETFCITALETALCGVMPIVRDYGALKGTLKPWHGNCEIVNRPCKTVDDIVYWAEIVAGHIKARNFTQMPDIEIKSFAWEEVAREWVAELL